jgi:hypothetical protein
MPTHQLGGVTVIEGRDHRFAVDGFAVENSTASIISTAPTTTRISIGKILAPSSLIGASAGRRELQVVAAPDVFSNVLENNAQRDGGHDPAEPRF